MQTQHKVCDIPGRGEAEGGKMMIILRGFAVLPCLRELQGMMFWKTKSFMSIL